MTRERKGRVRHRGSSVAVPGVSGRTPVRVPRLLARLLVDRTSLSAAVVLVAMLAIALFGSDAWRQSPSAQNYNAILMPPSLAHPLGTDPLGRDMLARMISGAGVSFFAVAIAVSVAVAVSVAPGLVAGYVGGLLDMLISRFTDAFVSFPGIILAIAIVGIIGPGLRNAMVAIGIILFPRLIRVVRASVLAIRDEPYVEAARVSGCSNTHILVRHIFPNVVPHIIVQVSNLAAFSLLAESGLSFLGLGVQLPQASWGSLLQDSVLYAAVAPWMWLPPGIAILLAVLSFNLLGDGLQRSIGPTADVDWDRV